MQTESAIQTFVHETGGWAASQLEACTRCGMCAEACHFYQATGTPEYAPVWKIELLRRAYEQRFTLSGRLKAAVGLQKRVTDDDLIAWSKIVYEACTVCNGVFFDAGEFRDYKEHTIIDFFRDLLAKERS